MWILDATGDLLQGKRMWLKPGKKYLFGRVKKDGVRFAIDHKTVSRKHFVIDVAEVGEGDVARIHTRTKITIIDQNSKSGTWVEGVQLKGDGLLSRELKNAENSVRPGSCPDQLMIRWLPCVLTFNLLKKEVKAGGLKIKQDRIKGLDIKVISEFVPEHTTHLVVNKRNTPKGLQALINGKYLVAESFVDALEYATTPTNLDDDENLSPLEADFDSAWPQARKHLPSRGREPTTRPDESYQPNSDRVNIFEHFVFVFAEQSQYDNLLPVITSGHGKALLFKVINGETTTDEAIQYMQNASREKGFGEPRTEGWRGGAIMVRWSPKNEFDDWTASLINQIALKLDQRAIDQAEFLDAILANDATLLRQKNPYESTMDGKVAPPPSGVATSTTIRQPSRTQKNGGIASHGENSEDGGPRSESALKTQVARPGNTTGASQDHSMGNGVSQTQPSGSASSPSRFGKLPRYQMPKSTIQQEFDDGFDPDAIMPYEDDEDEDSAADSQFDDADQFSAIKQDASTSSKKRRRSPTPDRNEDSLDDDMGDLLPTTMAMKRRKLASDAKLTRDRATLSSIGKEATKRALKKVKKEKEIDVRELARAQRAKEDEAAKREREDLAEALPYDIDDKQPANLAVVVQMELPVRQTKLGAGKNPEDDPRWDPKWNGRKNFKKFRPQGEGLIRRTGHSSKVIVPLIEVKRSTNGLGDKYWEKSQEEKEREKRRRAKIQRIQNQNESEDLTIRASGEVVVDDDLDEGQEVSDHNPALTLLEREAVAFEGHEIDFDSPRTTRSGDRSQTQTQAKKRTATQSSADAAKKKQKTLPVTNVHASDSEESDDMKFRFNSRVRRGKG